MMARRDLIALGTAALVAVAMPMLLLRPGAASVPPPVQQTLAPLAAPAMPPLATAFERPLFAPAGDPQLADALPGDAPALIGIVGRLDQDAVALVRAADGSSRTLHIGESVDGWQLASLALDAAFFTRGTDRVRVPLPVVPSTDQ
jgi:hypothetical protein